RTCTTRLCATTPSSMPWRCSEDAARIGYQDPRGEVAPPASVDVTLRQPLASRTESLRCHRQCDAATATGEHLTVLWMLLSLEDHESGAAWYMAMNVGDWLRSLGLGKYEATFRDSEIDSDILHELTESDLEKLGLPLGHRKRLLKAIVGLGAAAMAP